MVDPNRKINRLSDKDIRFLEECEEEFGARYTEDDDEFMAHCAKPLPDPPLIENWLSGSGAPGGGGGGGFSNNRYNGGHRRGGGDRGWQRRGYNYNNHNNNNDRRDHRRNNYEAYPRRDRGGGNKGDRSSERHYQHRSRNESQQGGAPMQVRRDYGNFVPASKD